MSNKNFSYRLFLTLVSVWWGWTVLIDFFVLPSVFKTVNDFFNAGELGMTLFSQLNILELIVSSLLIVVTALKLKQSRDLLPFFILTLAAFSIVIFYLAFLTPKIITLTDLWREAEKLGVSGMGNIPDIQQEHQFFHKLYIRIDSVKLIILTILLGTGLLKQDKWA